ncbi:MAG: ribulose bisphosphate carboxylase small subunit [Coleofasciculaceae cyanobacterium]
MSYYISPRFLNKLSVHITKNFLDLPDVRVPLILGIHGRKGEGKTFQCELVFERMGVEAVHMSAGELESPDAGDPARLIRLRYRETAEMIRVKGKMCVLMLNDFDAGAGRFDRNTQYTVNTQLVQGTLMNMADNPTNVQLPGSYDSNPIHRVPIIVTGNDFSTLYEPLIRDGRMEKFYWEPDKEDRLGIVGGIFSEDGLSKQEIEQLIDAFPNQPIDFFSALRARLYDEQILQFIDKVGIEKVSARVVNSIEGSPQFKMPNLNISGLIKFGKQMSMEQKQVDNMRLAREYNQDLRLSDQSSVDTTVTKNELAQQPVINSVKNSFEDSPTHRKEIPSQPLDLETQEQIRELLARGCYLSIEHANERQFRSNAWKSSTSFHGDESSTVIGTLAEYLAEHGGNYVRLIGADPKTKRRVMEKIIQRPQQVEKMRLVREYNSDLRTSYQPSVNASTPKDKLVKQPLIDKKEDKFNASLSSRRDIPSQPLDLETQEQIRELLAGGYYLSIEYANERQFRSNAWKSSTSFHGDEASAVIETLAEHLAKHLGDYVRLIAADPKAKRRVMEKIIQRPH